ncbi:MAG: anthranilate synthase component I [Armatimonadetes bacterium]|nr:anthranilate synthase component I [Armatimonadota bacterium]
MTYHPSVDEFRALAARGQLIPVYREVPADLETPVSAFSKLRGKGYSFLLESVEKGEQVGRYSFLGANLSLLLRVSDGRVQWRDGSFVGAGSDNRLHEEPLGDRDPLDWLRTCIAAHPVVEVPGLPSFWGGAVGFLGYDVVRAFERLPDLKRPALGVPDCMFLLTDRVVVFDHVRQKMQIVVLAQVPEGGDAVAAYEAACQEIAREIEALRAPVQVPEAPGPAPDTDAFDSTMSREDYKRGVEAIGEHIRAGDIFQAVLSQRLRRHTKAEPLQIYRALRMLNPSPYMFFLDMGEFQLIGSSPEMLVKLGDGVAETRPIAGTRHRAADEEEDRRLASELLADPKERAEHVMLVDLGRNDLGRVCEYGTVRVPTLMEVERYSHVMHIVSSVKGRLNGKHDQFDLVRACFPAGTLSGAPKIRAMEILEELEPTRRGPYGGAVGYFAFNGNTNTCITIRTILRIGEDAYMQVGAGIVADSDPDREYRETLDKVAALRRAVEMAERGLE